MSSFLLCGRPYRVRNAQLKEVMEAVLILLVTKELSMYMKGENLEANADWQDERH